MKAKNRKFIYMLIFLGGFFLGQISGILLMSYA